MSGEASKKKTWASASDIELGAAVFGAMAELSSDYIGISDPDGRIRYVNPAGRMMLGLPNLDEVENFFVRDIYDEDEFARQESIIEAVKKHGRWDGERVWRHYQTGEEIPVYQSVFHVLNPQTKKIEYIGTLTRILSAERRLLSHLSLFKKATEASTEGLVITDARYGDQPIIYVNPAFTKITGFTSAEASGRNCRFLQGEGSEETLTPLRTAIKAQAASQTLVKNYKKDGSVFWNQLSVAPVKNTKGETTHFVGIQRDVTSELEAKRELTRETERLQLILSSIEMGIWEWNLNPNSMTWDDQMYNMHKVQRIDLIEPQTWWQQHIGNDHLERIVENCLQDPNGKNNMIEPIQIVFENGDVKYVRHMARLIRDENGEPLRLLGVAWDVTAEMVSKRTIEGQRLQIESSARLAALGEMAGGVAHEINNPLAIISAFVDRLRDAGSSLTEEDFKHCLNRISLTVTRIAGIVKGLRAVAREGSADPFEQTTVRSIVNDTLSLCAERARYKGIDLFIEGQMDIPIQCRVVQISQVLANLLSNALFAVDACEVKWVRISVQEDASQVTLRVTDSGPGIAKDIAAKIFQPFFTTKGAGVGTGLGLSISTSIVRDHNGSLTLDSSTPQTTFVITLPKQQIVKAA